MITTTTMATCTHDHDHGPIIATTMIAAKAEHGHDRPRLTATCRCCSSSGCRRHSRSARSPIRKGRMGGRSGDIVDAPLARRLARRSHGFRGSARRRLLFAVAFAPLWRDDWAARSESERTRGRARRSAERRLETTSQGPALSSRLAPPGIASLCVGLFRRWTERVAYPAAVASAASGSRAAARARAFRPSFWPMAAARLCRRAPRADRPDRRPEDSGDAHPSHTRACPGGSGSSLTDLGSCAFRSDIAAMRHESQYSRLFRS